jgi:hypothetical protein
MNYIQFSNRVVPAKKWYEEGHGLVAPHRFRYFDKEFCRRKERREVKALIKLTGNKPSIINLEFT